MTSLPLDRESPLPLWAQLLADLRRRVAAGEFAGGFPTDDELRRSYGVSRQTVREAVRRLQADGVVVRERGRRSSLNQPVLEQPLQTLYSLARTAEDLGLEEHSEVLALRDEPAGPAAGPLGLAADEPVVHVERLRFVGEEPISLHRSWLPSRHAAGLLDCDLRSGSLYEALGNTCGIWVTGGWERIQPDIAGTDLARLLGLRPRDPVLVVERLARAGTTLLEWRRSVVRGDRYCFRADWSAS